YLPRMMPSTSNTPTLTCESLRCSTIAFASAIVFTCRGSIIFFPGQLHLGRAVAFALRMAVLAAGEREFFLGRKHELVPSDEGEVQDAEHVPGKHQVHAASVQRILELIPQSDDGDDDSCRCARNSERAAIRPLDVRHLSAQLNEGDALEGVRDH